MTLTWERTRVIPISVTVSTAIAPTMTAAVHIRSRSGLVKPLRLIVAAGRAVSVATTVAWTTTATVTTRSKPPARRPGRSRKFGTLGTPLVLPMGVDMMHDRGPASRSRC
jgi:hypothetical protein